MVDPTEHSQAQAVIAALRAYADRIGELMRGLEDKRHLSPPEKDHLRSLLKSLKEDLKKSAKVGTVSGRREPLNRYESAYFQPAVLKASANCRAAVNTDPLRSDWYSSLYGIRIDITHLLSQLEERSSDA